MQEQVDNIKSTNPVSTEDMKAAVDAATKALEKKVKDLQDLVDGKVTATDLEAKIKELEGKLAAGDKTVADALAAAKTELTELINGKASQATVDAINRDIEALKGMKTTLQALIDAENKFIANPEDLSGFENTSFDKFINQSIINALNDKGENKGAIAQYVIEAVQAGVASNAKALNEHIEGLGITGVKDLTGFVDKIYNEIFKENGVIKKQLDSLDELLKAINAHVGTEEGQSKDYAALINEIVAAKNALTALQIPEGKTFGEAVQGIIDTELTNVESTLGKLKAELEAEITALKGMIQSIVYVPEYADGLVQLSTFYAKFGSNGNAADWEPMISGGDVKVRFRVSPSSAAKELIDNFGQATAKYNVAVDYQTVKTRATGELFNITKIEAVEDEANLIEVTLDASKAAASYAIALTLTDKVEGEAKTLNEYFFKLFRCCEE